VLSGRGLCDELITRPEESYGLWCVVVCDLETSRICAPYICDISSLSVNITPRLFYPREKPLCPLNRRQDGILRKYVHFEEEKKHFGLLGFEPRTMQFVF